LFRLRGKGVHYLGTALVFILSFYMGTAGAVAEGKGILMVGHFSEGMDGKGVPVGWSLKNPGSRSKIAIEGENGNYFLRMLSVNDYFGLGKKISFDICKYPYLSWRWKASKLPEGGDIRKRETDEQAGQIYVVFPKFPKTLNTRSVGYIWDSQAPVGFSGTSTAYSKMKYIVLQSGPAKLNQWISEVRDVYEDYKKLFQEEPPTLGGVVLYINTQHTKSSAEIYYANIFFSSSPTESPGLYGDRIASLRAPQCVSVKPPVKTSGPSSIPQKGELN
jgi:hypothetical protein